MVTIEKKKPFKIPFDLWFNVDTTSQTDNIYKITYALKVSLAYLLVAILAGRVTVNFQVAFGITFAYQFWNLLWIQILSQSQHVYSIQVLTEMIPGWIQLSLPSEKETLKIRKDQVVTSISEVSGIRGGHLMIALRVMTSITCCLTFMAIQYDLHHRKTTFTLLKIQSGEDMVPLCLYIAAMGKFLTGHFELNMMDMTHTTCHFLGVSCIFFGALGVGFCLKWNMLSIILLTVFYGLGVTWVVYCATCPKTSTDIQVVTRTSKICIGIELAMFNVYATILAVTCYACGQNEGNAFASPFV